MSVHISDRTIGQTDLSPLADRSVAAVPQGLPPALRGKLLRVPSPIAPGLV